MLLTGAFHILNLVIPHARFTNSENGEAVFTSTYKTNLILLVCSLSLLEKKKTQAWLGAKLLMCTCLIIPPTPLQDTELL